MAAKAGAPASNREVTTDHNEPTPLTDEQREALYLTHVDQARRDNSAVDAAMEVLRGIRKGRTRNRTICRTDGFPLEKLDRNLKRENMDWDELVAEAKVHALMDRAQGLPTTGQEQLDLFGTALTAKGEPSLDKDDGYWAGIGYRAGKKGDVKTPPDYVPPEYGQAWMAGWDDGQTALAKAWEMRNEMEARRKPA